jgi:dsRNA-specific ribonuclease
MTEKKIALVKNESIGKLAYEMGLNKWYILSANAEEKKTRTNLKKLGCLFEAFLGALFLDFNKIDIQDDDKWFDNVFVTGPGFQIAQIFVESIFDNHVNWLELLQTNDNYKNRLQVVLQKAFKVTPIYMEISEWDEEEGYHMGVFLCIGQHYHGLTFNDAKKIEDMPVVSKKITDGIEHYITNTDSKLWLFLGESKHKIKKKAEQAACKLGLEAIEKEL